MIKVQTINSSKTKISIHTNSQVHNHITKTSITIILAPTRFPIRINSNNILITIHQIIIIIKTTDSSKRIIICSIKADKTIINNINNIETKE